MFKGATKPLYTGTTGNNPNSMGNWQWGGEQWQVDNMRKQYEQGITEAQSRQAPQAQNVTIEQAPQDQFRQEQMDLLGQLQAQASGIAPPSQAEVANKMQAMEGVRRAQALAASARGVNPMVARRAAVEQTGDINIAAEQQRQLLRQQEQQQAQQDLLNMSGQIRGQDIGLATSQAGLEMQTALANMEAQQRQQGISDDMVQFYENLGFSTEQAELQAQIAREQMLADIVQQQMNAQAGIVSSGIQNRSTQTAAALGALATGVNTYYRGPGSQPTQTTQSNYTAQAGSTAQPTPPPPAI
jgi:hypothetical protein